MKIFAFDPADYREQYEREGWVHIKNGIHPEFLEVLREKTREHLEQSKLDAFAIKGKKEQALFEFPDFVDYPGELFDVVSELCGLERPTMTLSERHIQAYEPNAAPEPAAHKDRFASQVSLGFSIDIPAESKLVLYPYDYREINPFNSSAALYNTLQPDQRPEVILKSAREVVLDDEDGDIVAFPGSTTWHLRRNAANAVNLYCKFNDFHCDPLGEDPNTPVLRSRTLELLQQGDGELDRHVVVHARRLDLVTRHYTRQWQEALQANLYGEEPFALTEIQYRALQRVNGGRPLGELVDEVADGDRAAAQAELRRLAELGALDLLPA